MVVLSHLMQEIRPCSKRCSLTPNACEATVRGSAGAISSALVRLRCCSSHLAAAPFSQVYYVASESGLPLRRTGCRPRRHINADATLPVKCGAPHFTGENPQYGILGGIVETSASF